MSDASNQRNPELFDSTSPGTNWGATRPRAPRGSSAEGGNPRAASHTGRLLWFLIALSVLLLLRYVVPYYAELIQYSLTRGRQRAEYESAGRFLESLKLDELSQAYQLVSQRVAPSVVNIAVLGVVEVMPQDELSALFGPQLRARTANGSGVIVDAEGYILTNNHVVEGATEIQVSLADGRTVVAKVVGTDPLTDLAVLKISADQLTPGDWGDSDALHVGALVWAVGSPFGLQQSITAGILSGKNRQELAGAIYHDFLQSDAAVNPGNSGGPLVDSRGRIVGINTAIIGEGYQGISFAIPANEARAVYERLRAAGYFARGWLGVGLEDMTPQLARQLGVGQAQGVVIIQVMPRSPADRAGLRTGDVILQWDGRPIDSSTTLRRIVARTGIGESVEVVISRGGVQMTVSVQVGERPDQTR